MVPSESHETPVKPSNSWGTRTNPAHHVVLVLQEDAELLEEGDDKHQELLVIPIQSLDQQLHNVLVPHLQLCARILGQVQEQVQSHWNRRTGQRL